MARTMRIAAASLTSATPELILSATGVVGRLRFPAEGAAPPVRPATVQSDRRTWG